MSLNVAALNDFNNETAGELLVKSVYAGSTMEYITIQEGVKYLEPINLFEVGLYMQNGTCVSTPSGSATFTQRNIQVCPRTSFDQLCLKDLDTKYLGITALGKGSYNETFALAGAYSDLLVNQFQKANDLFIWQQEAGVPSTFGGTCATDGLKFIISGSTAGVSTPAAANVAFTSANALTVMDAMIEGLSEDVVDRDDLTFFMSISNFKKFIVSLRTLNNYFFDPSAVVNKKGLLEMMYPYQNIKVVGTTGLQGSNRIVLGPAKQAVAGTDLMSDFSSFQLWYDINTDTLKHRISTKLGVQVAFPEYWVSNDRA
jgi:hypothetical protein